MRKKNFVTLLYFTMTLRQKAIFAKTGEKKRQQD